MTEQEHTTKAFDEVLQDPELTHLQEAKGMSLEVMITIKMPVDSNESTGIFRF